MKMYKIKVKLKKEMLKITETTQYIQWKCSNIYTFFSFQTEVHNNLSLALGSTFHD